MRGRVLLVLASWLALGATAIGARAAEVSKKDGTKLQGSVREEDGRILVNPFRSTAKGMTYGVVSIPASDVESIRLDEVDLAEEADALAPDDVGGRVLLLREARDAKDDALAFDLATQVLLLWPGQALALDTVGGGAAWRRRQLADPALDAATAPRVASLLWLGTAAGRAEGLARLVEETSLSLSPARLERMAASLRSLRGVRHGVPIPRESSPVKEGRRKDGPAGTASLYVPWTLDPLGTVPLVVALHDGTDVAGPTGRPLGTARDVFELLVDEARRRGWVLACPDAVACDWSGADNQRLVDALLAYVESLLPVDLDRVYLAGLGTGADGALRTARRTGRGIAAVAAACPSDAKAAAGILASGRGVWLYRGETDPAVPVGDARKTVERLRGSGRSDLVYLELPGVGHGLPVEAERDLFAFFAARRLPRAKPGLRRSSLDQQGDLPSPPDLSALSPAETVARLRDPTLPLSTRVAAARRLGALGEEAGKDALFALADLLQGEDDFALLEECVSALEENESFAVAEVSGALRGAIATWMASLARPAPAAGSEAASGPGGIPYVRYRRKLDLTAGVLDVLARVPERVLGPDVESLVVVPLLRDERTVIARADRGEDAEEVLARLLERVARCYRAWTVDPTEVDLLRALTKRRPHLARAVEDGLRGG